jgi:hypothetical protein
VWKMCVSARFAEDAPTLMSLSENSLYALMADILVV